MKAEINLDIVLKLFNKTTSNKVLKNAIKVFKTTNDNLRQQIILGCIALTMAIFVGVSKETVKIMVDSIETIISIVLSLFGIIFTGYAFFQALLNNELLIRLIVDTFTDKNCGEEKSRLQESNESFVGCMMLNILAIFASLVLKIIISCIPEDFLLFERLIYNNVLATFGIGIYFYFIITIVWEMKSFVFNIFQMFNAYAGTKVLNLFKQDHSNLEE